MPYQKKEETNQLVHLVQTVRKFRFVSVQLYISTWPRVLASMFTSWNHDNIRSLHWVTLQIIVYTAQRSTITRAVSLASRFERFWSRPTHTNLSDATYECFPRETARTNKANTCGTSCFRWEVRPAPYLPEHSPRTTNSKALNNVLRHSTYV